MDKEQLTCLIIKALSGIGKYSPEATQLILGTIAQESAFGKYRKQLGCGIALGICQIEPDTFNDTIKTYLKYRPDFAQKIKDACGVSEFNHEDLIENDALSIAFCRCKYLRCREPLPMADDIKGMAMLWKLRYNTPKGAGTEDEFIKHYKKYVLC